SRRDLLRWGFLGAGAWVLEPVISQIPDVSAAQSAAPRTLAGPEKALRGLITRHAAAPDNPWAVMHGVRAIGKQFSVNGGSAIDYLIASQLQEQVKAGRTYLVMPSKAEGHQNTFLKTILELGVSLDFPVTVGGHRRRVADLLHDAKQLFTYEPGKINGSADELSWSIIALAMTTPPNEDRWTNAQGRQIRFRDVVAYAFDTLDWAAADFQKAMAEGRIPTWKDRISNFTCGGTHLIYALGVAVRHGHLGDEGRRRFAEQLRMLIWRLRVDPQLLDEYYKVVAKTYPDKTARWRPYQLDSRLKFLGHAFEVLSYNRLFRLAPLSSEQEREVEQAGPLLAQTVREVARLDFQAIKRENRRLFDLLIGDVCHAYHGIHMVRGENQV
ncbi:MAG: hypothetical protein ACREJ6_14695, partial [Candidatus Methylomirabilis sp.]